VFVLNADSSDSVSIFQLMKDSVKMISQKFGVASFHYAVVIYGDTLAPSELDFSTNIPYPAELSSKIDTSTKVSGSSVFREALNQVKNIFKSASARINAKKAVVIIQDKKTTLSVSELQEESKSLVNEGMVVVAVGIGNVITLNDERALTIRNEDAMIVYKNETAGSLSDRIVIRILKGKLINVLNTITEELLYLGTSIYRHFLYLTVLILVHNRAKGDFPFSILV